MYRSPARPAPGQRPCPPEWCTPSAAAGPPPPGAGGFRPSTGSARQSGRSAGPWQGRFPPSAPPWRSCRRCPAQWPAVSGRCRCQHSSSPVRSPPAGPWPPGCPCRWSCLPAPACPERPRSPCQAPAACRRSRLGYWPSSAGGWCWRGQPSSGCGSAPPGPRSGPCRRSWLPVPPGWSWPSGSSSSSSGLRFLRRHSL